MKWYRVRELYYYDGRVTSELSGTIQAKARPESEIIERDDYSEFIDWYDTKEHAKIAIKYARKMSA